MSEKRRSFEQHPDRVLASFHLDPYEKRSTESVEVDGELQIRINRRAFLRGVSYDPVSALVSHFASFQHCRFDQSIDHSHSPIHRSILTVPMSSTHSTTPSGSSSDQLTEWRDLKRAPTSKVFTEEEDPGYVSDPETGKATPRPSTPIRNGSILGRQSRDSAQLSYFVEEDPGYVSESRTGYAKPSKSILSGIGSFLSERGPAASTAVSQAGRSSRMQTRFDCSMTPEERFADFLWGLYSS
jgi:hypothetical protein